MNVSLWR